MKAVIRLRGYTGWSASLLLFACLFFSGDEAHTYNVSGSDFHAVHLDQMSRVLSKN